MFTKLYALLAILIMIGSFTDSALADQEESSLIVVAADPGHADFLILKGSDSEITWEFIAPEGLSRRPTSVKGTVKGSRQQLEEAYERIHKMEAERNKRTDRMNPLFAEEKGKTSENQDSSDRESSTSFTLLLLASDGKKASYPLSFEQRKVLIEGEELKEVFRDIRSKRFLGKTHNMLEFMYVDPNVLRGTATERTPVVPTEKSAREAN